VPVTDKGYSHCRVATLLKRRARDQNSYCRGPFLSIINSSPLIGKYEIGTKSVTSCKMEFFKLITYYEAKTRGQEEKKYGKV
jgi:hypothetical protein